MTTLQSITKRPASPPSSSPNTRLIGKSDSRRLLSTPALVLDLDALEHNLAAMAAYCRTHSTTLRPHAKTHKSTRIAALQAKAGAAGICCATLREAQAMIAARIPGVLITSPIVGEAKLDALMELLEIDPRLMLVIDSAVGAVALEARLKKARLCADVLIDVDVGMQRTGVPDVRSAISLARRLDRSETGGGTGTFDIDRRRGLFTECQAGSYVFMDVQYNEVELLARGAPPFKTSLFVQAALRAEPLQFGRAVRDSIGYTGYNIAILPMLIFVARNFASRREALVAGALAGPLILLPGFAFLLTMSAFYPAILDAPLPVSIVLAKLGNPVLTTLARIVILGAFTKTGVGLLHGLNERFARSFADKGRAMPRGLRPAIAIALMTLAVFMATSLGIVELIARGYRYSSYFFLIVLVIPLATRGLWLICKPLGYPDR